MSFAAKGYIELPEVWYTIIGVVSNPAQVITRPVFSSTPQGPQWVRITDSSTMELSFSNKTDLQTYLTNLGFTESSTPDVWGSLTPIYVLAQKYDLIKIVPMKVYERMVDPTPYGPNVLFPSTWYTGVGHTATPGMTFDLTDFQLVAKPQEWLRLADTDEVEMSFYEKSSLETYLSDRGFIKGEQDIWRAQVPTMVFANMFDLVRVITMRVLY